MIGWIRGLVRRILGRDKLDELQERMRLLEKNEPSLERKVIEAYRLKEAVQESVEKGSLSKRIRRNLRKLDLQIPKKQQPDAMTVMNAAAAIEKYNFKRFVPNTQKAYPKSVISMKEFMKHPELYIHKLSRGFLTFPINFNIQNINAMLGRYGNIQLDNWDTYSNNGTVAFVASSILDDQFKQKASHCYDIILHATNMSGLEIAHRGPTDEWIRMDTLDFLSNCDGLVHYFTERHEFDEENRTKAAEALEFARYTLLTAIETIGKARIKDPCELLNYNYEKTREIKKQDTLKECIAKELMTDMPGTTEHAINGLLNVRSKPHFIELAHQRTKEILTKDKERKGLTQQIGKDLKDYTIGESIVLACYFARNIIQSYERIEDAVKNVLSGRQNEQISGKCTDYTGLALQYLREYLVPLDPEKFRGWVFGYEATSIGDYRHCYMKIMHTNQNNETDIYFVDPTILASKGIKALKTPKSLMKYMDTGNHPLQIERDAEDLLRKPIE